MTSIVLLYIKSKQTLLNLEEYLHLHYSSKNMGLLTKSDDDHLLSSPLIHHSQDSAIQRTGLINLLPISEFFLKLVFVSTVFDLRCCFDEGTIWTAVAHIITGVIGSGVLSLAWSMAQLGWIAGPLLMLFFAGITLTSTFLMCDCYRSPDPEHGPVRNRSFTEAVEVYLGEFVLCI